ncbi:MAG TPA: flavin-binding protein [Candidatus Pelagibacter bacterium]|jgi:3-hydroxyisobutyrate dehydrogenase|nr:flavin-binding protein [Candidatus Pelagibacter bacterium]|tara:strand:- start:555 stop:1154 length:600 start_codon:yes stop_codon:yes gene_type:complete
MQPAYYEDFKEIKKKIWSMLDDAVTNRSSQFRIPVFICGDHFDFDGRIVVLRKSDQSNNLLQFHSDIRSVKIPKLKNNKNASLLFHDKNEKIQIRLKVECTVNHKNEVTKQSWSKTGHISRKCYLVDNGPGTESPTPTSGLKPELDNFEFTMKQSEKGYENFTVIQCKIKSIEWLYLAAKGHRRARFDLETNKESWLVP